MNVQKLLQIQSEGLSYLSRVIRHPRDRERCAQWVATNLNAALDDPDLQPPSIEAARAQDLVKKGVHFLDLGLTADKAAEIRARFSREVTDKKRGEIPTMEVVSAPYLLELATSPEVLSLAAAQLGAPAFLIDFRAWWTFGGDAQGDQVFHRDGPCIKFCKIFAYLTDVTDQDGPHEFVIGSHSFEYVKDRIKAKPHGTVQHLETMFATGNLQVPEPLVREFLAQDLITITGRAGTTFMEDTYAIHRGKPPAAGRERLIFSAVYSMTLDPTVRDKMSALKTNLDWMSRVPDTPLARYAISPWSERADA